MSVWRLKELARRGYKGFELAYRLRQKVGGYYIGASARFAGRPIFPNGYAGVYVSGGARVAGHMAVCAFTAFEAFLFRRRAVLKGTQKPDKEVII